MLTLYVLSLTDFTETRIPLVLISLKRRISLVSMNAYGVSIVSHGFHGDTDFLVLISLKRRISLVSMNAH